MKYAVIFDIFAKQGTVAKRFLNQVDYGPYMIKLLFKKHNHKDIFVLAKLNSP